MTLRIAPLALSLVLSAAAIAQPITHLGQDADDHVTLALGYDANPECGTVYMGSNSLYRINASGNPYASPFTVPSGYRLIVTDVSWASTAIYSGTDLTAGRTVTVALGVSGATGFTKAWYSPGVNVPDSTIVSGSHALTAGFSVGAGNTVCGMGWQSIPNGSVSIKLFELILHGYLIAD